MTGSGEATKPTKPTGKANSVGFVGWPSGRMSKFFVRLSHCQREPRCPHCASYALYRKNNQGDFECCTCGLQRISEPVARAPRL